MSSTEAISYRPAAPEDLNFIYATWLNSFYFGSKFAARIPKSVFYEYHQQVVEKILSNPITKVLIACRDQDPDTIFGYLVYQEASEIIIQYCYVKGSFQGYGIARDLVTEAGIGFPHCVFTHWTIDTNWVIDKYPELTYIPYLMS